MKIYLAGGALGNNNAIWRNNQKTPQKAMKIFLATPVTLRAYSEKLLQQKLYILESFYYAKPWMDVYINKYWDFMLDSGAFTFMSNKAIKHDWNDYIKRYAEYIIERNIKHFFELDIDVVVGLKEVERMRDKLEILTQRKCIPVWHRTRGKEAWEKMIKKYNYVAIGCSGQNDSKWTRNKQTRGTLRWFLKSAHDENCKLHGLGYTTERYTVPFDSVDSTAWIYGNRSGFVCKFKQNKITKISAPKGMKLKTKEVAINNFREWVKYQKYADKYM